MTAARRAALVAGVAFLLAIAGRALPVHAQSPEGHEGSTPIPKEVAERLRMHQLRPLLPIHNTPRARTRHLSTTAPLPPVSPRRTAAIQTLERPRISGYLFAAETGQPLPDTEVQLCPDEACRTGISTITDGAGYYEFAFDSLLQVVTDTEQSVGYYTPGEIHAAPHGGEHSAIYSVWYSGEDYRNRKHKHQLAYVYANRPSWGWEKATEGLRQFFVLHPPMDLPLQAEVDPTHTPVVFVHGHAGRDSTWMGLRPSMENRGYQTWEVYYPGRDHIVENAAILRDAVDAILQHYDGAQVDMVTHSMGGPVSRSYAAGTARYPWDGGSTPLVNYTPKLRWLLQLAPTSSGVLNMVRLGDPFWRNRCAAALELFEALGFQVTLTAADRAA